QASEPVENRGGRLCPAAGKPEAERRRDNRDRHPHGHDLMVMRAPVTISPISARRTSHNTSVSRAPALRLVSASHTNQRSLPDAYGDLSLRGRAGDGAEKAAHRHGLQLLDLPPLRRAVGLLRRIDGAGGGGA